jgi:DNA-binding protein H-NS
MMREVPALSAQLAALNERITQARDAEIAGAIAQCREIIELFGLTAYDLGLIPTQVVPPVKRVKKTFAPVAPHTAPGPIFRDPASGETWNGRGAPPPWMNVHERDEYLVRSA